jgi:uncharacterized membrane protein YphA (DoxX/SURF4 family)
MSISRRLGRPLLSSIFVFGGLDAVRHPDNKVKAAEPVAQPIAQKVPGLPKDTETLVRLNGMVQVVAGAALAIGKFRRIAALALIGSIIPTTAAGHRFWEETDDAAKAQQLIHFLKNLGLLGGLILAAVDTEGAPSLSWRARRNARRVAQAVTVGGTGAGGKLGKATRSSRRAGKAAGSRGAAAVSTSRRQAKASLGTVTSQLHTGADRAGRLLAAGSDRTGDLVSVGAERAGKLISAGSERTGDLVSVGAERAGKLISAGSERTGELISEGAERAAKLISAGSDRTGDLVAKARSALPVG